MNNLIRERLDQMGLSQSKASRMADIPYSNFNMIVNGKLYPCPAWRNRIATVLQVPESKLFPELLKKEDA